MKNCRAVSSEEGIAVNIGTRYYYWTWRAGAVILGGGCLIYALGASRQTTDSASKSLALILCSELRVGASERLPREYDVRRLVRLGSADSATPRGEETDPKGKRIGYKRRWHGSIEKRVFLKNEPKLKTRMYLGMKLLGETQDGFV